MIAKRRKLFVGTTLPHFTVMAGHSRPKDGVASLAYVPAIHKLHHIDTIIAGEWDELQKARHCCRGKDRREKNRPDIATAGRASNGSVAPID